MINLALPRFLCKCKCKEIMGEMKRSVACEETLVGYTHALISKEDSEL
jgi:hypothetical protein